MIVRTREEELERLKTACKAMTEIMISNSHLDPDFKDIIDFDEFIKIHGELLKWMKGFEKKLEEVKKNEKLKK